MHRWTVIQRFHDDGSGLGTGADCKPWISIGDFASTGCAHDPVSPKTGRSSLHLLVEDKYDFFLIHEWATEPSNDEEEDEVDLPCPAAPPLQGLFLHSIHSSG